MKSGILKPLEPSGPLHAYTEIALRIQRIKKPTYDFSVGGYNIRCALKRQDVSTKHDGS